MKVKIPFFWIIFCCVTWNVISAEPMIQITLQSAGKYTREWAFNSGGSTMNNIQMISTTIQFPASNVSTFQIIGLSDCYDWKCGIDSKSSYVSTQISVKSTFPSDRSYIQLSFTEYFSAVDYQCEKMNPPTSPYLPLGQSTLYTSNDGAVYRIAYLNSTQANPRSSLQLSASASYVITSTDVQPAILVSGNFPAFQMSAHGMLFPYSLSKIYVILPTNCQNTICGLNSHSTYTYSSTSLLFNNQNLNYVTLSGGTNYSPLDDKCLTSSISQVNLPVNVPSLLQIPVNNFRFTLSVLYQYV